MTELELVISREIHVKTDELFKVYRNEDGFIESVKSTKTDTEYKINNWIVLNGESYYIKKIRLLDDPDWKFSLHTAVINSTTRYLLPCLDILNGKTCKLNANKVYNSDYFHVTTSFLNAFISYWKDTDKSCKKLYLLYYFNKEVDPISHEQLLHEFYQHPYYNTFEMKRENYYLYTFNLPKEKDDIYKLFIAGKFSQYPEEYKFCINKFFKNTKDAKMYLYLNHKDKYRKYMEEQLGVDLSDIHEFDDIPSCRDIIDKDFVI